jgi:hypothetical protein
MMARIRITSGNHKGRYIGLPVGSGWGTNAVAQNNPLVVTCSPKFSPGKT